MYMYTNSQNYFQAETKRPFLRMRLVLVLFWFPDRKVELLDCLERLLVFANKGLVWKLIRQAKLSKHFQTFLLLLHFWKGSFPSKFSISIFLFHVLAIYKYDISLPVGYNTAQKERLGIVRCNINTRMPVSQFLRFLNFLGMP